MPQSPEEEISMAQRLRVVHPEDRAAPIPAAAEESWIGLVSVVVLVLGLCAVLWLAVQTLSELRGLQVEVDGLRETVQTLMRARQR